MDREAAARAIEDFLRALGLELEGDLAGTGRRVAEAWSNDLLQGMGRDPLEILRQGMMPVRPRRKGESDIVLVRDLAVTTMCPHHLMPAYGTAVVAFHPDEQIVGIGTIASVVDALSRRLTLQETIGSDVVRCLMDGLKAKGALCRLSMTHTCLVARGERKCGTVVETLSVDGTFAESQGELTKFALSNSSCR